MVKSLWCFLLTATGIKEDSYLYFWLHFVKCKDQRPFSAISFSAQTAASFLCIECSAACSVFYFLTLHDNQRAHPTRRNCGCSGLLWVSFTFWVHTISRPEWGLQNIIVSKCFKWGNILVEIFLTRLPPFRGGGAEIGWGGWELVARGSVAHSHRLSERDFLLIDFNCVCVCVCQWW